MFANGSTARDGAPRGARPPGAARARPVRDSSSRRASREFGAHVRRGREAALGVLLEAAAHDAVERGRSSARTDCMVGGRSRRMAVVTSALVRP